MDRLVINIENDNADMSVYHNDTKDGFEFEASSGVSSVAFVLSDEEAKNLADSINVYLNNRKDN